MRPNNMTHAAVRLLGNDFELLTTSEQAGDRVGEFSSRPNVGTAMDALADALEETSLPKPQQ